MAIHTIDTRLQDAEMALAGLTDAQRVAFCILTVNKITDPATAFQLTRLSVVSKDTALDLADRVIDREVV